MELPSQFSLEEFNRQLQELAGAYRGIVQRSGITLNEFWLWYALIAMPQGQSQQQLCETWAFRKQTVNTIIASFCKKGYVTLEPAPATRNRKLICLTEEGRRYGEALVLPVIQAERRALASLDTTQLQLCMQLLRQYTTCLEEALHET